MQQNFQMPKTPKQHAAKISRFKVLSEEITVFTVTVLLHILVETCSKHSTAKNMTANMSQ